MALVIEYVCAGKSQDQTLASFPGVMCKHVEPRHGKTCLQGFQPGQTQTGLCIAKRLETLDLKSRGILLRSEIKCVDQLRAADLRLCFRICKFRFSHDAAQLIPAPCEPFRGSLPMIISYNSCNIIFSLRILYVMLM